MKIYKTRNVKTPTRGTEFSAGIDFYVPVFTESFVKDLLKLNSTCLVDFEQKTIRIRPHRSILIPSGIKVNFERGKVLIAFNKSGISSKFGLDCMASVIDADYEGEVHLSLHNTNTYEIEITEGMKILQFIMIKIPEENIIEITDFNQMYHHQSTRGTGGFGSTDQI